MPKTAREKRKAPESQDYANENEKNYHMELQRICNIQKLQRLNIEYTKPNYNGAANNLPVINNVSSSLEIHGFDQTDLNYDNCTADYFFEDVSVSANACGIDDQPLDENNPSDIDDFDNTNTFDFTATNANPNVVRCLNLRTSKKKIPRDANLPLVNVNEEVMALQCNPVNKADWVAKFIGVQSRFGATYSHTKELLILLKQALPEINWPMRELANGNYVIETEAYLNDNCSTIEIHICKKGCMAYTLDTAAEIRCKKCREFRYTPCPSRHHYYDKTVNQWNESSSQLCNPFIPGGHSVNQRNPQRVIFYRSVIATLQSIVDWSIVTKNNIFDYEKTRIRDLDSNGNTRTSFDILDSTQARDNLKAMRERFELKKAEYDKPFLQEVSLVLGEFYDGAPLFGRKTNSGQKSVWPLVITILNACPSDRMHYGIALFVIAIHDLTVGCGAEQSLFDDYFIPELQKLREGVLFSVTQSNGEVLEVFLQARLIVHTLDTIALQKKAGIHGANSTVGCMLCNTAPGVSRKVDGLYINKMINIGHRCTLDETHPLRVYGMSKQCCPAGYYAGSKAAVLNLKNQALEFEFENGKLNVRGGGTVDEIKTKDLATKGDRRSKACDDYAYDRNQFSRLNRNRLANYRHQITDFEPYIQFAHMDLRKPVIYKRRKSSSYKSMRGRKSVTGKVDLSSDSSSNDSDDDSDDADIEDLISQPVKGVNSIWSYDSLPSASIHNALCYDPFHALMNLVGDLINLLSGSKGCDDGAVLLCQLENRFASLKLTKKVATANPDNSTVNGEDDAKRKPTKRGKKGKLKTNRNTKYQKYNVSGAIWVLSQHDQERFDAIHNCIVNIKGTKNNAFRNVFGLTSALKGHDKIKLITSYINVNIHFTELHSSYKQLLNLISAVICDICSPVFYASEVPVEDSNYPATLDTLFVRTAEMLAFIEGMFPDSEQHFTHHEILDIVHAIKRLGPIRSWWALAGERFFKHLKNKCPDGGSSPMTTISGYYFTDESGKRHRYSIDASMLDNNGRYRDNRITLNGNAEPLKDSNWTSFVYENLMSSIYNFLQCSEIEMIGQKSGFYRLYRCYDKQKARFKVFLADFLPEEGSPTFRTWLQQIILKDYIADAERNLFSNITDITPGSISYDEMLLHINNGVIFRCDMRLIVELSTYKPAKVYKKAVIKGIDFDYLRGQTYSETTSGVSIKERYGEQATKGDKRPQNNLNDLLRLYHMDSQSSCWCKIKSWFIDVMDANRVTFKWLYAQLNYCFRLLLVNDSLVSGLSFGNVTCRDPKLDNDNPMQIPHLKLRADKRRCYFPKLQMVCLNYVESTNVQILGMSTLQNKFKQSLPILVDKSNKESFRPKAGSFTTNIGTINELYLVDLHPERRHVRISLEDSKLVEK